LKNWRTIHLGDGQTVERRASLPGAR